MPSSERQAAVVARHFLALGSGEAIARLIAFGGVVYVARTLGAASYGIISFAAALMLYPGKLADAGIEQGIGPREIAAHPDQRLAIASTLATVRLILSALLAFILLGFVHLVFSEPESTILTLMAIVLVFQGGNTKWILLGLESTRTIAALRMAGELVTLTCAVLLIHGPGDIASYPLALAAGEAALILALLAALKRSGIVPRLVVERSRVRSLAPRAVPLMLSALLGLIIFNSDLLFLRFFRDAAAVGLYAAAYALISFLINLGTAYQQSLLPSLTRAGQTNDHEFQLFHTTTAHVLAATLPAALGVWVYAPEVIELIYGEAYRLSATPLGLLALSALFLLNRSVPHVALIARGREDLVLRVNAIATAFNLATNIALIPTWGLIGAAVSTVVTEAARCLTAWILVHREGFPLLPLARWWKATVAAVLMVVAVLAVAPGNLWVGAPLGAVVYFASLAAVNGLRRGDRGWPVLTV